MSTMGDNIIHLTVDDGRNVSWKFPDGTELIISVPKDEPPITVKHAIYCLSSVIHRTHTEMMQP